MISGTHQGRRTGKRHQGVDPSNRGLAAFGDVNHQMMQVVLVRMKDPTKRKEKDCPFLIYLFDLTAL